MDNNLGTKKHEKSTSKYHCEKCDYSTSHMGLWKRHLKTRKHMDNKWITMDNKKNENEPDTMFTCECGKSYKYKTGLCKHKLKLACSRKMKSSITHTSTLCAWIK